MLAFSPPPPGSASCLHCHNPASLELILAESPLLAGGTDSQGTRAEQEGTGLPLAYGVRGSVRADPRAVSGQTAFWKATGPHTAWCPGSPVFPGSKAWEFNPKKVPICQERGVTVGASA